MPLLSSPFVEKWLSFAVNVLCHTFILLTFLSVFFFTVISKLTSNEIDHELDDVLSHNTDLFLQQLDARDKHRVINWPLVGNLCANWKTRYSAESQNVTDHNRQLYDHVIIFVVAYGLFIIAVVVTLLLLKVNIRLKFVLLENFVIFTLVGIVEVYFFTQIASKYVPVLPNIAVNAVVQRMRERFNS
jgi:hypothetical protein